MRFSMTAVNCHVSFDVAGWFMGMWCFCLLDMKRSIASVLCVVVWFWYSVALVITALVSNLIVIIDKYLSHSY